MLENVLTLWYYMLKYFIKVGKFMKKLLCIILSVVLVALTLCACTDKTDKEDKIDVDSLKAFTLGVPTGKEPAENIFCSLYTRIAKKGYRLEYVEFETAQEANDALAAGEIDASLISLKTDFDKFNEEHPETLLNLGAVCRYPYGIFLCNFEKFESITDEATIAIPETPEGVARALLLLEANGLIKVREGAGLTATIDDITENNRKFKFVLQDDKTLAANLKNYEADIAVMSSKISVEAGFALNYSACAIEDINSEAAKAYSLVLLINRDEITSEWYKAISPLFFSPLMYDTIDEYKSDKVVPAFNK